MSHAHTDQSTSRSLASPLDPPRTTSGGPHRGAARTRRSPAAITLVLALTGTIVSLQQTLIIPVLPELPRLLGTTADNASWLVTATLLTSAIATPIVSRLADMYGKRRMVFFCLAMQMLGSTLGGLGATLPVVVAGRALQGFAASLIPVGISIMRDELPRERVGGAVALMSATLGIGSAVGLPLAGVIYAHTSWHVLFWMSASMALVMVLCVWFVVPESGVRTPGTFDGVGAVLLSSALVCLLLPVTKGNQWGWASERTLVLFVLAALLVAAWVPWELRTRTPMVDLRTAARRPVLLTNLASLMVGFSMYGNMLSTTQLLQMPTASGYGFGLSVLMAGLCMLPSGFAMVFFSPVSARITRQFGARVTLIVGGLTLAAGYMLRVLLTGELWHVVLGALVVSIGTAIAYAAMPTLIMAAVPITETASANGVNSLLRAIGTSSASAAVASILTGTVMHVDHLTVPSLEAFKHIFWLCAAAALVATLVAAFLPSARPAPVTSPSSTAADEVVVTGRVRATGLAGVRQATVTITDLAGMQVDWSRVDADGSYAVVVPRAGRYLAVVAADGWAPHAQLVELGDAEETLHVDLGDRLQLTGTVRRAGQGVAGALVTLTRIDGQAAGATTADEVGGFAIAITGTGRHVVTAADTATGEVRAATITLLGVASSIELDLAGEAQPVAVGAPRRARA